MELVCVCCVLINFGRIFYPLHSCNVVLVDRKTCTRWHASTRTVRTKLFVWNTAIHTERIRHGVTIIVSPPRFSSSGLLPCYHRSNYRFLVSILRIIHKSASISRQMLSYVCFPGRPQQVKITTCSLLLSMQIVSSDGGNNTSLAFRFCNSCVVSKEITRHVFARSVTSNSSRLKLFLDP